MAAKRALAELTKLQVDPSQDYTVAPASDGDPLRWTVVIAGPGGSPYEGGSFVVNVDLSAGYPFKAPTVSFETEIYHCNLGRLVAPERRSAEQLLRLSERWHPSTKVADLLDRIVAVMREPVADALSPPAVGGATIGEGDMMLSVETPAGEVLSVAISAADTVEQLVSSLAAVTDIPSSGFALLRDGKELSRASTLEECGVVEGDRLRMALSARLETSLVDRDLAALLRRDQAAYERMARRWAVLRAGAPGDIEAEESVDDGCSAGAGGGGGASSSQARPVEEAAQKRGAEEEEDEDEACQDIGQEPPAADVSFPCPICGSLYAMSLLGVHLQGHFAFQAMSGGCEPPSVEASPEGGGSGEADGEVAGPVGDDELLAARLQQEEMERALMEFEALAADRLAALRVQAAEVALGRVGAGGRVAGAAWVCHVCTCENADAETQCTVCSAERSPPGPAAAAASGSDAAGSMDEAMKIAETLEDVDMLQVSAMPHIFVTAESSSSSSQPAKAVGRPKKARPQQQVPRGHIAPPMQDEQALLQCALADDYSARLGASDCERREVARVFLQKLGARAATVHEVERVRSPIGSRFRMGSSQRLMFHGCKCSANETSILRDGFQVSQCVSGGRNYGTWFAYAAAYSDAGFAFNDDKGVRHMFICVVSDAHIVMNNPTMRVVGQLCAYPVWLVKYSHAQSKGMSTFNVGAYGRWAAAPAAYVNSAAPHGYEASGGQWVPIMRPPASKSAGAKRPGAK